MSLNMRPNPLLEGIPIFNEIADFVDSMAFHPLQDKDIKKLTFMEKDAILSGEKVIFTPTTKSIMAAMTWYGMLKVGLQTRNPVIADNKKKYFEALDPHRKNELKNASTGMSVNLIRGPTGTGKTITIQRFCSSLPQVIEHGKNDAAGWAYHLQLVYLHINLSHDGSRHGFLYAILQAMDAALGTQYSTTLVRQNRTVEKLSVATIARLVAHNVGIIFIDESQLRNLVTSSQAELMQLFLLSLMNSGIPIVICGNERAFDWLNFSQDLSRLALTPSSHFYPIGAINSDNWELDWEALIDSILKFYVLDEPPRDIETCKRYLYQCSGGIARLAIILWTEAQRYCLFHQKSSLDPGDIQDVYLGQTYKKLKPLADGFYFKNADLLKQFPDVDYKFYWEHWSAEHSSEIVKNEKPVLSTESPIQENTRKGRSEKSKFKAAQTAAANKAKRSEHLKETLPEEDMRQQGLKQHHLHKFEELRDELEGDRS